MRYIFFLLIVFSAFHGYSQSLTGKGLLEKAIKFHDPNNAWKTFKGNLKITMETPNSSNRISNIHLDIPKQKFILKVSKDSDSYTYHIQNDSCTVSLNGKTEFSAEDAKKFRLDCERGGMMKNYYTYLYGLPMKLNDPGTIIHPEVKTKTFKGKEYFTLKVTYTKEVGDDSWYFYFDPKTYAMEVYQFYHDEAKNDGEYILLKGMESINGIKMPKTRAWYYNKDDTFLGKDILSAN